MSVTSSYEYLGGDTLHTGIYVDTIRRLEEQGLEVGLVARLRVSPSPLALWRAWRRRDFLGPNRIEDVRRRIHGPVRAVPLWNLAPGLSVPLLARMIGPPPGPERRVVVHARQIVMARLALELKRRWPALRVIVELEGDALAELAYRREKTPRPAPWLRAQWALEHRHFAREERRILLESDAVICVSQKLKDRLVSRYSLTPERAQRVHAISTPASCREFAFDAGVRDRTRAALGLADRFVVVYTGSLRGRWQVPEKLAEAFAYIRQSRPDAFFLILTPQAEQHYIEPHLARWGVAPGDCRLLPTPHREVVERLCAADVGLILRDRHPMNEVAAPGKLVEYALTGLPLVLTEGIGDFSAPLRDSEFACVLPDLDDADDMKGRVQRFCARDFDATQRAAFGAWAAGRFATERSLPRVADLYRTV